MIFSKGGVDNELTNIKMQDYGLNEYLDRIGILSEDEEDFDRDEDNYLLHHEPYSSSLDHEAEPELHDYPFELDKDEEATREKTEERTEELFPEAEENPSLQVEVSQVIAYLRTFQGSKDDTMELSINFKTLLVSYFRQIIFLNQLEPNEVEHIEQFAKRAPSLNSIAIFYEPLPHTLGIRERCLQFWESSECLRRIMRGRSKLRTKLMMIKFIEKMRMNLLGEGQVVRWKDCPRWKQKYSYIDRSRPLQREKSTD